MNWSSYIIMQWLPTYLARSLGADAKSISLTAVPYVVNSLVGIGNDLSTINNNNVSRYLFLVAGHVADSLLMGNWSILSVRRLMTSIGLIGPGLFLAFFGVVDNLLAAVMYVFVSIL